MRPRPLIRSLGVLAAVCGSALLVTAPSAHAGEQTFDLIATASCVDGQTTQMSLSILDMDPSVTDWLRIEGYDDQSTWQVSEGEFTASTTATFTTDRTQIGVRVYGEGGLLHLDSGLQTGCTGELVPPPPPSDPPVSVGDLSFTTSATCGVQGMTLHLGIANAGAATTVTVNRSSQQGGSSVDYVVGDIDATMWVPYMGMARMTVDQDGVLLYDTGWRYANENGVCGWAVPELRSDLDFSVDATCGAGYAHVTLTIGNLVDDWVTVAYSNGSGSDGGTVQPTGDGNGYYEFDMPIGNTGWVQVNDIWGRFLWSSGDLIANADGCLQPTIEARSELACVDGVATLSFVIVNNSDATKTIEWYYGFDGEDYLGNDTTNVPAHSTWAPSFTLPHGGLVDASARDLQPAISPEVISLDDAAIGDCTIDGNADNGPIGGGSESGAPTPSTTPATTVASDPGSLPVTGSAGTVTTILGLLLLGAGGALTLVARRRTA